MFLLKQKKRSKYNATKCEHDGFKFDSLMERKRYLVLKDRLNKKKITNLMIHPEYIALVNGIKIGKIVMDFQYYDYTVSAHVVEDVKGMDNALSRWKRKHIEAQYGIKVDIIKK